MHDRHTEEQLDLSLEQLVNGDHERCNNPMCRMPFARYEDRFIRSRGIDGKWYCDRTCASGPYLTPRSYSRC